MSNEMDLAFMRSVSLRDDSIRCHLKGHVGNVRVFSVVFVMMKTGFKLKFPTGQVFLFCQVNVDVYGVALHLL